MDDTAPPPEVRAVGRARKERIHAFLADAARRGLPENEAAPSLTRLYWALGLDVRPPVLAPFFVNLVVGFVEYALIFLLVGGIVYLASARIAVLVLPWLLPLTALFAIGTAIRMRVLASRGQFPDWEEYDLDEVFE